MRISDWSSDVCSSDLFPGLLLAAVVALVLREPLRSASQPRERRPLSADLLPFLRENRELVGSMFGGFSLLYVVTSGYLAWTTALFIRTHDMAMDTVGLRLGAAHVLAAVTGTPLVGGH